MTEPLRRVTQTLIEVDGDYNPKRRVTQTLIEVDLSERVPLRVTQTLIEVDILEPEGGVYTHGVAMPDYDGEDRGIPMPGDRAAWDTVEYAEIHARDIQAGTPTRHNPWPMAAGEAAVSDGTALVATDIATQAELDAHTTDTNNPHTVTLQQAYDADGTVELADAPLDVNRSDAGDAVTVDEDTGDTNLHQSVRVGDGAPAARLHLPAGTGDVGKAPLKFDDGGELTATPEVGAVEFDDGTFYLSETPGGARRAISVSADAITASTTVTNTTDETVLYTGPIAANEMRVGKVYRAHVFGLVSTANTSQQITMRVRVGGTLVGTATFSPGNLTADGWHAEIDLTVRAIGVSGAVSTFMDIDMETMVDVVTESVVVDTTVAEDITVTAEWGAANAGNIITITQGYMEVLH